MNNVIPKLKDPFNPSIPNTPGTKVIWGGLYGSASSLAIANAALQYSGLYFIITENVQKAHILEHELRFFLSDTEIEILNFPDGETLPYDVFSPLPELTSQRLLTLHRLADVTQGILIAPIATVLQRLPPRTYLDAHTLNISCGDKLNPNKLFTRLEQAGYQRVSQVTTHGEFAARGSLVDLFPMGTMEPFRIDLLDERIDSIRSFDPETQRSIENVTSIQFLPAREVPLDAASIEQFRQAFCAAFPQDPNRSPIYKEVSLGNAPGGIEYYLPLFYPQTSTLFDYLPTNTIVSHWLGMSEASDTFWQQVNSRYEQIRYDIERPLLPPQKLYLNTAQLHGILKNFPQIQIQTEPLTERRRGFSSYANFASMPLPTLAIHNQDAIAILQDFLNDTSRRVLFLAESPGRREHLLATLKNLGIKPQILENWAKFLETDISLALTVAPLEQGLLLADVMNIAVIPEAVLYGERVLQERRWRKSKQDPDLIVQSLTELNIGDPVVHEQHGVGRYLGMQALTVGGIETELLTLEYAKGDKLYVPIAALHLISRYAGASPETAPLHHLGSNKWEKLKTKAAAQVRDVAAELLDVQARRMANTGIAIPSSDADYLAFASAFQFEETYDQQQAINAVLKDLSATHPMDRVVCGDVGFGKTEVAMRAAFQTVQAGYQVAILVPTTLLTGQHYTTFSDRFADWPIRVESISRFRTRKDQTAIMDDLAKGTIDIIIGTHKLLNPDIRFKSLGLVIIDEEHRFGVRHKERLKALRAEVDLLTLTATPIPRTLNMSLAGMRDLSIIATPPLGRHPIKTFVKIWDDALITEACQRELKRGGQVYFLHNEVQTIELTAKKIQALLPTARCEIAHGQMRGRDLERTMQDFYHQRFNILVCTTIIESGIDIPTANTIIIDRADKLGLAQLHQLRGRVGRSQHRAYAYLLTEPPQSITTDAKKRLAAIEAMEELGAGFTLATHDLEIRGAGELLGEEQSGQIQAVGFNLYMELLDRAVQAIKNGQSPELLQPNNPKTEIELHISALFPETYIHDVHTRLVFYKRLANAISYETLWDIKAELIDRFGLLPQQAKNLFTITELKLDGAILGIRKLEAGSKGGRIVFAATTNIKPEKLVQLIQQQPQVFCLDGGDTLKFTYDLQTPEIRIARVQELLRLLGN